MIRPRKKARPGRLRGYALKALRLACFMRDGGRCVTCRRPMHLEPRFDGDPDAYDMAHKRNKRMHGDTLEQVEAKCHSCHMLIHRYGPTMEKPCPPKYRNL